MKYSAVFHVTCSFTFTFVVLVLVECADQLFNFVGAAELQVLLYVCFLNKPSLHLCFWLLLGIYQENYGL